MKNTTTTRLPREQRGIALFVTLVFLIVLTILGITALNNNTLQTRLSAGASQTNFAFQSAETAVLSGEQWIAAQTVRPSASCTTTCPSTSAIWPRVGLDTPPVTRAKLFNAGNWFTNTDGSPNNGVPFSSTQTLSDSSSPSATLGTAQPQYVIEDLGPDQTGSLVMTPTATYKTYYYQISGRGVGGQSNVNTVVQSVYAKGF